VTRLLLVRHGQSEWNAERRWQGRADPPLSDLGRHQAASASVEGAVDLTVDVVVTSSLARAHETARLLAVGIGVEVAEVHDDLQEREAGEWTGLTRTEIAERYPGAPENGARPPGYEPDDDVWSRSAGRLGDLAARHPGRTVLVVTHGGVMSVLAARIDPARVGHIVPVPNLGGFGVTVGDGRFGPLERIHLLESGTETTPSAG
jgi:probable phosphoglycerate mutase